MGLVTSRRLHRRCSNHIVFRGNANVPSGILSHSSMLTSNHCRRTYLALGWRTGNKSVNTERTALWGNLFEVTWRFLGSLISNYYSRSCHIVRFTWQIRRRTLGPPLHPGFYYFITTLSTWLWRKQKATHGTVNDTERGERWEGWRRREIRLSFFSLPFLLCEPSSAQGNWEAPGNETVFDILVLKQECSSNQIFTCHIWMQELPLSMHAVLVAILPCLLQFSFVVYPHFLHGTSEVRFHCSRHLMHHFLAIIARSLHLFWASSPLLLQLVL